MHSIQYREPRQHVQCLLDNLHMLVNILSIGIFIQVKPPSTLQLYGMEIHGLPSIYHTLPLLPSLTFSFDVTHEDTRASEHRNWSPVAVTASCLVRNGISVLIPSHMCYHIYDWCFLRLLQSKAWLDLVGRRCRTGNLDITQISMCRKIFS